MSKFVLEYLSKCSKRNNFIDYIHVLLDYDFLFACLFSLFYRILFLIKNEWKTSNQYCKEMQYQSILRSTLIKTWYFSSAFVNLSDKPVCSIFCFKAILATTIIIKQSNLMRQMFCRAIIRVSFCLPWAQNTSNNIRPGCKQLWQHAYICKFNLTQFQS